MIIEILRKFLLSLLLSQTLALFQISRNIKRINTITKSIKENTCVYDNVLNLDNCRLIDEDARTRGLGHLVYKRSLNLPQSLVENVIESILSELKDNSPIVEYWWRDEWMSLDIHKDVDEKLAQRDKFLRFPNHGHVLYLSVGTEVCGPTLLFDYYDSIGKSNNTSSISADNDNSNINNHNRLTIVHAEPGRLLRFQGDLTHGVPRPALAYLDPSENGTNNVIWTRIRVSDRESIEYKTNHRSVLLFNTWEYPIPLEIESIKVKSDTDISNESIIKNNKLVNTFSSWILYKPLENKNPLLLSNYNKEDKIRLKIGVLGDNFRRGGSDRYIEFYSPKSIKLDLLNRNSIPSSFPLYQYE